MNCNLNVCNVMLCGNKRKVKCFFSTITNNILIFPTVCMCVCVCVYKFSFQFPFSIVQNFNKLSSKTFLAFLLRIFHHLLLCCCVFFLFAFLFVHLYISRRIENAILMLLCLFRWTDQCIIKYMKYVFKVQATKHVITEKEEGGGGGWGWNL